MCRIIIIKLQCKKASCTNVYGSFRDDEESEYCEFEGSNDSNHRVRQRTRTEKGDEYCPDCEASVVTSRLAREVNQELVRIDSESTGEQPQIVTEESRQGEEGEEQQAEGERREQGIEEYRRTGRWPGVNMQSGFSTSREHNSRRER